jgi:hypothetical protein
MRLALVRDYLAIANRCQVFHPFYVFQIASLVLWSLDEYYYYAICIFVMSAGSIVTTLIETRAVRQDVTRLRA